MSNIFFITASHKVNIIVQNDNSKNNDNLMNNYYYVPNFHVELLWSFLTNLHENKMKMNYEEAPLLRSQ